MVQNPEISQLMENKSVIDLIHDARNKMAISYFDLSLRHGDVIHVRREGRYCLRDIDGFEFNTSLLRVYFEDRQRNRSGGEFRFLPNDRMQAEVSGCTPDQYPNPAIKPIIISDQIPVFLKELSIFTIQSKLQESRYRVATADGPAVLVQTRASDIHDGQFRKKIEGQQDIFEEIWYAKVFTLMHKYPGISLEDAETVLKDYGYEKTYSDMSELSVETAIAYYYREEKPQAVDITYLTAAQFIEPFPAENNVRYTINDIPKNDESIYDLLNSANSLEPKIMEQSGKKYLVETLADYPVLVDGIVYRSRLFRATEEDGITFHTFRSLEKGNIQEAYVRIDSICVNGVQGGDGHCDCRSQAEHERHRAEQGADVFFLSLRDHEGRGHGEGPKGATLELMRGINKKLKMTIGNAIAAQLFYDSTGMAVDERDYNSTLAILKYLKLNRIKYLVTNNLSKIAMVSEVARIENVVSAEVPVKGIEARQTIVEKKLGLTGTIYEGYSS